MILNHDWTIDIVEKDYKGSKIRISKKFLTKEKPNWKDYVCESYELALKFFTTLLHMEFNIWLQKK